MTPGWLLVAALSLPVFHEDRGAREKTEQLATIANAIDEAADGARWPGAKNELKALMLTVAWHETRLSLRIQRGECRRWECDRGRAKGPWQQHESSTSSPEAWARLEGTDGDTARHAAREAARALVRARGQCRSLERDGQPWLEMTLSAYAGRGCVGWFKGREARVATYRRLVAKAQAAADERARAVESGL